MFHFAEPVYANVYQSFAKSAFEYVYIENTLNKFITILSDGYGLARAFVSAYLAYWRRNPEAHSWTFITGNFFSLHKGKGVQNITDPPFTYLA